jgi:hypothetical protein
MTIPYWIAISVIDDEDPQKPVKIALTVISALILIMLALCGLFGAFKTNVFCLKQYGCMAIAMFIFTIILTILQYVALTTCDEEDPLLQDTVFGGICEQQNDYLFWIPSLIILFLTVRQQLSYLRVSHLFSGLCCFCQLWSVLEDQPLQARRYVCVERSVDLYLGKGFGEYFG